MTLRAVFPLSAAHLPGDRILLRVFEQRYRALVSDVMSEGGEFATVLIARGAEVGGNDDRFDHGVLVRVDEVREVSDLLPSSGLLLAGVAVECCTIATWHPDDPYPRAELTTSIERPLTRRELSDVASSLSLLAQRTRTLLASLSGEDLPAPSPEFVAVAAGRWWDAALAEQEAWGAFWAVARQVPCGPLDRHQFLLPGNLAERTVRLKGIIEHVSEVLAFRLGQ